MRTLRGLLLLGLILGLLPTSGQAAPVLSEWALNTNGTIADSPYGPPTGGAAFPIAGWDASGFDVATGIGTLTATVTGSGFVGLYLDLDIGVWSTNVAQSFNAKAAGQRWEIGNPWNGYVGDGTGDNIFDRFIGQNLSNADGTLPDGDEISWALAWQYDLAPDWSGVAKFVVSGACPLTGELCLAQTGTFETGASETYYFYSTFEAQASPPTNVPEPVTLLLLAGGIGGVAVVRKWGRA
jgi:hypothetical protein